MIKFYGSYDEDSKKCFKLKNTVNFLKTLLSLFLFIVVFFVAFFPSHIAMIVMGICLIVVSIIVLTFFVFILPKTMSQINDNQVWIHTCEPSFVLFLNKNKTEAYSLDLISKVVDAKSFYLMKVKGGERIICQKDLIKQGTLEDFESIFKGKIVKTLKEYSH